MTTELNHAIEAYRLDIKNDLILGSISFDLDEPLERLNGSLYELGTLPQMAAIHQAANRVHLLIRLNRQLRDIIG